ncbi:MAG: epoxyqueuosine reductase QueH, partial [Lachnospiraceae bacterium]|nr:epoxyqueuosine reductase QueH [Lachnospiraceae bacterium]
EGERYGVRFLPSDFKKNNGYLRSTQLSRLYGLYRQNYCGCIYSKVEASDRRQP